VADLAKIRNEPDLLSRADPRRPTTPPILVKCPMNLRKLLMGRAKFEKRRIMRKERRSEPRWRVEYLATIVSREGSPKYCTVTEMSDGGVRLNAIIYRVPEQFGLRLIGQAMPKCYKVIWRHGRNVGAKLIDSAALAETDRAKILAT